jgi:hypothetical protein
MDFITQLREHEKTLPRMEAIVTTVDWCIAHDILANFFRQHRKEVSNMILNELDNADAIEAAKEETWEKARKEERQQVLDLIAQGLTVEQLKQALQHEYPRMVL